MGNIGEGNGNPLQFSCLDNPMDGGAWWAAVSGVARSRTRLSDFTFTFHFHALEKEMATHSSVPAWRIPGAGEPGGLWSLGLHRVGHDWSDLAAAAAWVTFLCLVSRKPCSKFIVVNDRQVCALFHQPWLAISKYLYTNTGLFLCLFLKVNIYHILTLG